MRLSPSCRSVDFHRSLLPRWSSPIAVSGSILLQPPSCCGGPPGSVLVPRTAPLDSSIAAEVQRLVSSVIPLPKKNFPRQKRKKKHTDFALTELSSSEVLQVLFTNHPRKKMCGRLLPRTIFKYPGLARHFEVSFRVH